MRNSGKFKMAAAGLLIALTGYLSGCSAVGLGVGTLIDNSIPEYKSLDKDQILSAESGTKMTLFMEDGSFDHGEINGYTSETPAHPGQSGAAFSLTISERMLIFESSVYSDSARQVRYIPMDSVNHAQVRNARYAKYIGLGIGLLIDISIMRGIDKFLSDPLLGPEE